MNDKYYQKLVSEYISATGMYPTDKQLSDFFYERRENSSSFIDFLIELGYGSKGVFTEVDRGIVDTILPTDRGECIEISEFSDTFAKSSIQPVRGILTLDKYNDIIIDSSTKKREASDEILSSVLVESNLSYTNLPLYLTMFENNIDLYLAIFGNMDDKDRFIKNDMLDRMSDRLEGLSDRKLKVYSNDIGKTYQKVLCLKPKTEELVLNR